MKKFILFMIVLIVIYTTFFSEKARLDREVKRLCAIDGGVKVYETVTLPPDKFDEKYGQINFYRPNQGKNTLGPEYIFEWDIHYYKKGEPESQGVHVTVMKRDYLRIIRKSDMKLLGEFILYTRGGGDFPGPWVPSSYRCPSAIEASSGMLMKNIFVQSTEGDHQ